MTRWKSITVETRRETVDALSHFFTEHGALGMAYDERLFGPEGDPADPLPPSDEVTRLTAYFPWESDLRITSYNVCYTKLLRGDLPFRRKHPLLDEEVE